MTSAQVKTTCVLCFFALEDVVGYQISCGNPECHGKLCVDCMEHLLQYSSQNRLLPSCPVQSCKEIFMYSDVKKLDATGRETEMDWRTRKRKLARNDGGKLAAQYRRTCFDYFLKSDGDAVQREILERDMINKIRSEKLHFLENAFPEAVALVARVAFKHKLHKVNESRKALVRMKVQTHKRKCFFQSCTGFLEDGDAQPRSLICMLCASRFCKDCEKELNDDDHKCDEDDLKSVIVMSDMIRCPGCDSPVFKDVGCDFITCSNSACGVNFHYKTGDVTNHGSVNQKIQLPPEQRLLSVLYHDQLPTQSMQLLLTVESLRPAEVTKDIILRPIHKYMKQSTDGMSARTARDANENDLCLALEKYTNYKHAARKYARHLLRIERKLKTHSGCVCSDELEVMLKTALADLMGE